MTQGCLIRIVDDDEDMRESLSFLLESEGWKCSAYSSAREFLIEDAGSVPGCLILDIRMPEMTGLELQQEMNRRKIFLPIVFLTGHGSIDMAVSAMKSGAVEFLQKPVDHARLLGIVRDCVRRCSNGFAVLDFDIIEAKRRWETLTEKEQQVLTLIAAGLLNKEAAERLGNSVRTIENHRAAAMKRLQIKTLAQLHSLIESVKGFSGDEMAQKLEEKLKSLSKSVSDDFFLASDKLVVFNSDNKSLLGKLQTVKDALKKNLVLDIDYHAAEGNIGKRRIEPLCLYLRDGQWYVYAFCRLREDFKFFLRFRTAENAGKIFAPHL